MSGYTNATELADYLVKKGIPFRTAHETVGRVVLFAIEQGAELNDLTIETLKEFSPEIEGDVFDALTVGAALAAKSATGGTSTERVNAALAAARGYLDDTSGVGP